MRLLPCLVVVSAALLAQPHPADACSQPLCWPGAFLPGDHATIPQNAPGLYWRPTINNATNSPPDPATVRLTAAGNPLAFTATRLANGDYVIVPTAPLAQGTSYVLEDTATCGDTAGPRVTFTAGPTAPLPTSLGTVTVVAHGQRGEIDVATVVGSCSTKVDAEWVGIELAPSADATPWMPLFLFETVVDNAPWTVQDSIRTRTPLGGSWEGRGRDLLFRACVANPDASFPGMSIGGHQAAFRATLPNATTTVSTPAQAVELVCDATDPDPDPDPKDKPSGGCSSTHAGGSALLAFTLLLLLRRRRG